MQLKFNKTTVLNRNIKQFISLHTGYKRIEQTLILNHPVVVVYVFVIHQEYSEDHDINIRLYNLIKLKQEHIKIYTNCRVCYIFKSAF